MCTLGSFTNMTLISLFCPSLRRYWTKIFDTMSRSVGITFEPNVMTAVFGISPPNLSKYKAHLIAFTTLLARRLILMKWKSPAPPSHIHWIRDVLHFIKLEKIRCTLRGSVSKFEDTWAPFLALVNNLQFQAIPD